jgi:large subunit ribosomal protein L3
MKKSNTAAYNNSQFQGSEQVAGMMDERIITMSTKKNIQKTPFALLGKKVGMTQIFKESGEVVPVTVVEVGPCVVTQKKTIEKDGYNAIQIAFDDKKKQRVLKPEAGHFAASKTPVKRFVKEVRMDDKNISLYEVGQILTADLLKEGDIVDVAGTSIGKGFQGVMKRHHFSGFPMTHGTHEFRRHGGSIGCRTEPGKVFKNKRMSGQMGNEHVTVQNLKVAAVEADKNYVLIKGAVPGHKNGYVYIRASVKKGFAPRQFSKSDAPATEEAPAT